jgi:hypothetical protein
MSARTKMQRKAEQAIAALLTEPNHEAAAKSAGVSPATLQRWLRNPKFKAMFRAARRAVLEGAIGLLQNAAVASVEALTRNLTCGKPASEIRAAEVILTHAAKGLEMFDLAERVEELKETVDRVTNHRRGTLPPPVLDWPEPATQRSDRDEAEEGTPRPAEPVRDAGGELRHPIPGTEPPPPV